MPKKERISITIDPELLRLVDELVKKRRKEELERGELISSRSGVIEDILWSYFRKRRSAYRFTLL